MTVGRLIRCRCAHLSLLAAVSAFGAGCTQLLGITDITGVDGSITETTTDSGSPSDEQDSGETASDGPFADDLTDGLADNSQDGADARSCSGDLSNVHAGDFLISFTMQTDSGQTDNLIALINQRNLCTVVPFWDVELANQQIQMEISESTDQSRYSLIKTSGATLNDGKPHDVVITRTNNSVKIVVDGNVIGTHLEDQDLGALPKLSIGHDVCTGLVAFRGTITDVCVGPK